MRSQASYAFLIVLAACAGTRTGNPIGDDNAMRADAGSDASTVEGNGGLTGTDVGACKATPVPLDTLDQDTPLGFSAADVLAFAQGEHKTKIRWQANAGLGTAEPEADQHDLTLRIEPTSAKPRFVSYEEVEQQGGGNNAGALIDLGPLEGGCASRNALEIDVTLEIKSDGGALDEKVQGTLRATSASWAAIDVEVAAKDLGGSLHFTDSKVGTLMFTFTQLGVHVGLSPLGVRGELSGTFESDPDHSGNSGASTQSAASGGAIAEIGTDTACDPDGLSVTLDQKLQKFTAQDAIDLVNAAHSLALTWQDGSKAKLEIEFTHDGKAVCAVVGPSLVPSLTPSNLLRMFGTLSVSTDDDRIDADWPVVIEAMPAMDGTLGDVSVGLQSPNLSEAPIKDLAGEYGIHGIDASGYDGANIVFSLQFVAGTTSDLTGMLTVSGLTQSMCPPPSSDPEMGSPGCSGGIDLTTLDSATLSAP